MSLTSLKRSGSEKKGETNNESINYRQKSSSEEKDKLSSKFKKKIKSFYTNTTELSFRNDQYLNKIDFEKFGLAAPQYVEIPIDEETMEMYLNLINERKILSKCCPKDQSPFFHLLNFASANLAFGSEKDQLTVAVESRKKIFNWYGEEGKKTEEYKWKYLKIIKQLNEATLSFNERFHDFPVEKYCHSEVALVSRLPFAIQNACKQFFSTRTIKETIFFFNFTIISQRICCPQCKLLLSGLRAMIGEIIDYTLLLFTGVECQFEWTTRFYFWEVRGGREPKEVQQHFENKKVSGQNFLFKINNKCLKIPAVSKIQKTTHSLFVSDFDPSGKNPPIWFQPNFDYERNLKIFHDTFVEAMFTDEFFYDKACYYCS
jgi:hypothetical protein